MIKILRGDMSVRKDTIMMKYNKYDYKKNKVEL